MTDQMATEATENIQDVSEQQPVETVEQAQEVVEQKPTDLLNNVETTEQADQVDEADSTEAETTEPEGAPEKYEFQNPEDREYDPGVVGVFSEVARELNLTQEGAQKILDTVAPKINEKLMADATAIRDGWAQESRNDPEIGGNNESTLNANITVANKSIEKFGDDAYRQLLSDTGIGNHPAVIRMHMKVGKAISEDTIVTADSDTGNKPTEMLSHSELAANIYPEHK